MEERLEREYPLLGEDGVAALRAARVILFGVGGVGSAAGEALVRCGIGGITVVDGDRVMPSNINRQLIADTSVIGESKAETAARRWRLIAPDCEIISVAEYYTVASPIPVSGYDYVLDCIDNVGCKISIAESAVSAGVPCISCMGAGNKLDPTRFEVADISKTSVCPLARAVRIGLRKKGINHLKLVYSREQPTVTCRTPASVSFVPPVAGYVLAGEVIKDISGRNPV